MISELLFHHTVRTSGFVEFYLEDILGANIPAFDISIEVMNRVAPTTQFDMSVTITKEMTFISQVDGDFNGVVSKITTPTTTVNVASPLTLPIPMLSTSSRVKHKVRVDAIGGEVLVSFIIQGKLEVPFRDDATSITL